ncbi:MAG: envelope stress response membrane protein PspB [Novosphingobium sp.]
MFPVELILVPVIVIGLPWLILHYITKWKTAPTLTNDDETLLDDLYQLARRLEDRVETVERLVAVDHPDFRRQQQLTDGSSMAPLAELREAAKLRSR